MSVDTNVLISGIFFTGLPHEIYVLREKAGLTQRELAKLVGTTPSVISRLENTDYKGHSLSMLRRIAAALDRRVEIHFVPLERKSRSAWLRPAE